MYIDDCVQGIDKITHCDDLIATPINLGSSELVSINELLSKIEKIAGVKMNRKYDLDRAAGRGRPQLRQHVHPESPQMGAGHDLEQRPGGNLRVDQGTISSPQSRQTHRHRLMNYPGSLPFHRLFGKAEKLN